MASTVQLLVSLSAILVLKPFIVTTQKKSLKLSASLVPDALVVQRDNLFVPLAPISTKFQMLVLCAQLQIIAELALSLTNVLLDTSALLTTQDKITLLVKNAQPELTVVLALEYLIIALTELCQ